MAENDKLPPASSMSLPPPPSAYATAPGQQQYDGGTLNGQGNPAHMPPPPLPPVVIPQNTNPIPTAIISPGGGDSAGMMSPGSSAGSFVRRAAPEPNKRALYVGGLDPRVTEDVLRQIFETTGHVQNVKIIPDKNAGAVSHHFFVHDGLATCHAKISQKCSGAAIQETGAVPVISLSIRSSYGIALKWGQHIISSICLPVALARTYHSSISEQRV